MIRCLIVVAVLALSLNACANLPNTWTPLPPRPIGQQDGDTVETIPGHYPVGTTSTIISVVRAFDDGGMLAVCGAVVIAAPADRLGTLTGFVKDRNSTLTVGVFGDRQLAINPNFMHVYALDVPNGVLDAKAVDYGTLTGNCVRTEAAWRPSYRSAHNLYLRHTVKGRRVSYGIAVGPEAQ